jgi:hypothetical protein
MWDLAVTAVLLACGYIVYTGYGLLYLFGYCAASYVAIWYLPQFFGYYPIPATDLLWFHDTAVSKIYIQSCVALERMKYADFLSLLSTKGPGVNPRFRLCVRTLIGKHYWKQEEDFQVEKHIVRHSGPVRTREDLFRAFETYYQGHLDFRRSPWECYFVEEFGTNESAFFFKSHHILGDGLAMVSLVVSLADPFQDASFITIPRQSAWKVVFCYIMALLKSPYITYQVLTRREDKNCFHGPELTGVKRFHCSEPWPLTTLKEISKRHGVSLNTLMMACTAGALHKYAKAKGEDVHRLTMLIPYSLRALPTDGSALPMTNNISVLVFPIDIDEGNSEIRIQNYHRYNEALKSSFDPYANDISQKLLCGFLPLSMWNSFVHNLNRLVTFNFTNVPGPSCQLYFQGKKVTYITFAAPTSGKVGFTIGCFSYNQGMIFGCCSDNAVVKDPEFLIELIEQEFQALK